MNVGNDFKNYGVKHLGISSTVMDRFAKNQSNIASVSASLTPYVIQEGELRVTQIDIFSRMMMERTIFLSGVVDDQMSTVTQAQLMYLDTQDSADIVLHIDTPGGSVKSGLSIVDAINYIRCDVSTINTGMAASMGSILLGAGTRGKRFSLKHSRVMLHQVSSGAEGNIQDIKITLQEAEKYNTLLFGLLGEYTNKDPKKVMEDASRDLWLTSEEALTYGIIDGIVTKRKK